MSIGVEVWLVGGAVSDPRPGGYAADIPLGKPVYSADLRSGLDPANG